MNRKIYSEATYRALESGLSPEAAVLGLRTVLTRHGHVSLYGAVLKDVVRMLEKKEKNTTVTVLVAKQTDVDKYAAHVARFVEEVRGARTEVVVDETLVGGFIAKTTAYKRDQSYKESLASLYRALTV